jgi:hypothetical protein
MLHPLHFSRSGEKESRAQSSKLFTVQENRKARTIGIYLNP